jgi:hypothetical protein
MGDPELGAGRPSRDGSHLSSYGSVSTPLSYPVRAGQPPSYTDLPIPLEEQGQPPDDTHNEDGVMKAVDAAAVGRYADNVDKWKMPITNLREYLSTPFEDGGQATRAEHLKTHKRTLQIATPVTRPSPSFLVRHRRRKAALSMHQYKTSRYHRWSHQLYSANAQLLVIVCTTPPQLRLRKQPPVAPR